MGWRVLVDPNVWAYDANDLTPAETVSLDTLIDDWREHGPPKAPSTAIGDQSISRHLMDSGITVIYTLTPGTDLVQIIRVKCPIDPPKSN